MRHFGFLLTLLLCIALVRIPVFAQETVDAEQFFKDTTLVTLYIKGSLKAIDDSRNHGVRRPGLARMVFADGTDLQGPVEFSSRGKLRFKICNPPPLMVDFKIKQPSPMRALGKLKMVWACSADDYSDQLVLREFLIYRLYQQITPYSLRVRLLQVHFSDSSASGKTLSRKGFLIEDIDDLAERVRGTEIEDRIFSPAELQGNIYALMAMFQYMIGNTDWSVANYQNIKLIAPDTGTQRLPIIVPYDFDNSGMVNAEYAGPHESMPIENVRERYNKAIALGKDEVAAARKRFMEVQPLLKQVIESEPLLKPPVRRDMLNYMQEFFNLLKSEKETETIFLKK